MTTPNGPTTRTVPLGTVEGITGSLEVSRDSRALALRVHTPGPLTIKLGPDGAGPVVERRLDSGLHRIELAEPIEVELRADGKVRGLLVEMQRITPPQAEKQEQS